MQRKCTLFSISHPVFLTVPTVLEVGAEGSDFKLASQQRLHIFG